MGQRFAVGQHRSAPVSPDAVCTAWGTANFESESFLGSVSETVLELRDGYTATSQPGNTRVKFTIGLDRVP